MIEKLDRILFASDFSEEADHALNYALLIAERMEAELILFHSIPEIYDFASRMERIIEEEIEEVSHRFRNKIKEIRKTGKYQKLKIDYSVKVGKTVTNVQVEAQQADVDLIVMGYQDYEEASKLKKMLFGNVTSEVVLSSGLPVLAVPIGSSEAGFKQIVFASNYHEGDLDILHFLAGFASEFDSSVNVIHVDGKNTPENTEEFEQFREKVNTSAADFHFTFSQLIEEDFAQAISNYVSTEKSNLLVMGRKRRNFLQYIFTMGAAEELEFCRKVPLLVVPMD